MPILTDTRQVILNLKRVKEERGLSLDNLVSLLEQRDETQVISKSTLSRIFADGSEDNASSFRYETTLKPLCAILLDIDSDEEDDSVDTAAFKSLLRYKADLLSDYERQNKALKEELETIKDREKIKYAEKLEKETKHFNDSVNFLKHQISLKDLRIDKLMDSNERLSKTNDRLMNQLLDCPLRKGDCE